MGTSEISISSIPVMSALSVSDTSQMSMSAPAMPPLAPLSVSPSSLRDSRTFLVARYCLALCMLRRVTFTECVLGSVLDEVLSLTLPDVLLLSVWLALRIARMKLPASCAGCAGAALTPFSTCPASGTFRETSSGIEVKVVLYTSLGITYVTLPSDASVTVTSPWCWPVCCAVLAFCFLIFLAYSMCLVLSSRDILDHTSSLSQYSSLLRSAALAARCCLAFFAALAAFFALRFVMRNPCFR